MLGGSDLALSHDTYPVLVDVAFQAAFAIITIAIITGSLAGRMKFGAVLAFISIWLLLVYAPLAHMVWGGDGSLIGDTIGALDFAGGDVVHISSGLTGLILCVLLGKRRGYGMMSYRPHNIPFVALGASLLWFGWFGFNGASAFAADGVAALAFLNTMVAPAAAMISWMLVERLRSGKATLVGACTGIVAGLVVITPAAGFVDVWAAVVMGLIVSPICYSAMAFLKPKLGYDDALDASCRCTWVWCWSPRSHWVGFSTVSAWWAACSPASSVCPTSPGPISAACCTPVIPRCSSLRSRASLSPSCSLL